MDLRVTDKEPFALERKRDYMKLPVIDMSPHTLYDNCGEGL